MWRQMRLYELIRLVNDSDLGHDEVNVLMNSNIYLFGVAC